MNKMMLTDTRIINLSDNSDISRGCVVAVGSFDGVHLGHKSLLATLRAESDRHGVPAVVFSFNWDDCPKVGARLLAQGEKKPALLANSGVDVLVSARFSNFKGVSASDFALGFLYGELGVKSVVCGYDFRFGNNRVGDVALLDKLLSPKGVTVISATATKHNGLPVSSTLIRTLVSDGNVKQASDLLGRRFSFSAQICRGAQLGRTLGFPTANQVYPPELALPKFGVYAVTVTLDGKTYGGVANIGVKPTVDGACNPLCETYIFGYSGDCYGSVAEISFVDFIRPERRFPSVEELALQVARDKETAFKILEGEGLI